MIEAFFREKLGPLTLRLALGSACVYHGFLKIMCHGGAWWTRGMPTGMQLTLSWGEFVAGIAVLLGWYCRWAAATALTVTIGTLAWWHGWNLLHQPVRTLEPALMLALVGLSLVFQGLGAVSFDGRGTTSKGSSASAATKRRAA